MRDNWKNLQGFPDYIICNTGEVIRERTGSTMKPFTNQQGIVVVSLKLDGRTYARSVTRLVADHFLTPDPNPRFDTPIQLDGDRSNNDISNLVWRPRWFAIKFHHQFKMAMFFEYNMELIEDDTEEVFASPREAVKRFGVYFVDVVRSTVDHYRVFPYGQTFTRLSDIY